MSDKWEVDNQKKCYEKCSHVENMEKDDIILSKDLWHVLCAMLVRYKDKEWQMMLTGEASEGGVYCSGYYIPKQEVSAAYVENKDNITKEMIDKLKIVCAMHSHVNMGVTPSSTDINDSVMSLIDYHFIINNKHDMQGMKKAVLPCGGLTVVGCDVSVHGEVDLTTLKIEGLDNIKDRAYTYDHTKKTGMVGRLFDTDKHGYQGYPDAYHYAGYKDYSIQEEKQMAEFLMKGDY